MRRTNLSKTTNLPPSYTVLPDSGLYLWRLHLRLKTLRNECLAPSQVVREVEQLWMIAQFLQNIDRFERLRILTTE